jgi:hypothetical protein
MSANLLLMYAVAAMGARVGRFNTPPNTQTAAALRTMLTTLQWMMCIVHYENMCERVSADVGYETIASLDDHCFNCHVHTAALVVKHVHYC